MAMKELDAQSMSKAIFSKLEQMGLDYKGCLIGMGFDGASVMSGRLDFAVTGAIGKSATVNPEKPFHTDIFLPILDCMLSELDRRFSCDSKEIL
eukprot:gene8271-14227_t